MRNRLHSLIAMLCCLTIYCALDGHIFLLQTAAWVRMTYFFSQSYSVTVAVRKTFDGKHPCSACKKIGKVATRSQHFAALTARAILKFRRVQTIPRDQDVTFFAAIFALPYSTYADDLIALSPPKPPPRFLEV